MGEALDLKSADPFAPDPIEVILTKFGRDIWMSTTLVIGQVDGAISALIRSESNSSPFGLGNKSNSGASLLLIGRVNNGRIVQNDSRTWSKLPAATARQGAALSGALGFAFRSIASENPVGSELKDHRLLSHGNRINSLPIELSNGGLVPTSYLE